LAHSWACAVYAKETPPTQQTHIWLTKTDRARRSRSDRQQERDYQVPGNHGDSLGFVVKPAETLGHTTLWPKLVGLGKHCRSGVFDR
jgi:hypothetical protein